MPETWILVQLIILVVLLFISGFFSGSETALISVNKIRIRKLAEEGDKRAKRVNKLLERPNRLLATILVGNNLVNIFAAAIATSVAMGFFGNAGIGIATGILTLILLIFGEITPKGFATRNSLRMSLVVSGPIEILVKILYPLVKVITFITNKIIRFLGGEAKTIAPFVTEEEIKMLMDVGEKEGVIEKDEREMIKGIFEFGDKEVKEIMVPRIDVKSFDKNVTIKDALDEILKTGYSRTPVFDGSIDNIIGILYTKDLLGYVKEGKLDMKIGDIIRPTYYVPETKELGDLLKDMQKKKIHMAIVVDEYGGTEGIVTMEDMLEEIVGEILDEYDVEEEGIRILDDRTAIVDSRTDIDDINEVMDLNLPPEEFETVGGLVFNTIGKIPVIGDRININGITLVVEKLRGRRISKVRIIKESRGDEST